MVVLIVCVNVVATMCQYPKSAAIAQFANCDWINMNDCWRIVGAELKISDCMRNNGDKWMRDGR